MHLAQIYTSPIKPTVTMKKHLWGRVTAAIITLAVVFTSIHTWMVAQRLRNWAGFQICLSVGITLNYTVPNKPYDTCELLYVSSTLSKHLNVQNK